MRLLIAGIAALAAVSFAAPSFAQDETAPAPAATPVAKPKPGTSAYCSSLKSSTQRSSCLKRIQTAKATKPHTKTKKPASATPAAAATSADSSAQAPAAPMSAPSGASSVTVPPLPQKTI